MNRRRWVSGCWLPVACVVALGCGSEAESEQTNVCLYEEADCHNAYSEIVGDSVLNFDGTCPPADSEYAAACTELTGSSDCSYLEESSSSDFEGTTYYDYRRNVRLFRGATCAEWEEDPSAFTDGEPADGEAPNTGDDEPPSTSDDDEPPSTSDDDGPPSTSDDDAGAPASTPETNECPVECAATAETEAACWPEGTACDSITSCAGEVFACGRAGDTFDCLEEACIACPLEPAADACAECGRLKCCVTVGRCVVDEECAACDASSCPPGTQPELDNIASCLANYCADECTGE